MKSLIVGMGEVGTAHYNILSKTYDVFKKDIEDVELPNDFDIIHICIRYGPDFITNVDEYINKFSPDYINICSTVPPGTTEQFGGRAVHSTTRGLHPNLETGLLNIKKHIGGTYSKEIARYFERAGISCVAHTRARTTELAHILNNSAYGVNLMLADEMAKICRDYGVDYNEAVLEYTKTNNDGYERLDHKSKRRMVLMPPNGKIGGHCVVQSAQLIKGHALFSLLKNYNERND